MSGSAYSATVRPPVASGSKASARSVFQPREHGSWSLVLEPLALGLLVAPSFPGVALAATALAGFFARRPLRAALTSGSVEPSRLARTALMLFFALTMAGVGETVVLGEWKPLWPLLLAAPFGALFAYFDTQGEARAAAAELAGSAAFAVLPAAFATLAGWTWPAALSLAVVALARSLPTVLTVRTYLRLSKRQPVDVREPLVAALLAGGVSAGLAVQHLVPALAVGATGLLLLRSVWLVSSRRPAWTARRLGLNEAVLGAIYVTALASAYRLP